MLLYLLIPGFKKATACTAKYHLIVILKTYKVLHSKLTHINAFSQRKLNASFFVWPHSFEIPCSVSRERARYSLIAAEEVR
jgi:hypothetical protein